MQDSAQSFNPFAPGFDFLQKLAAGGTSKPASAMGQWQEWVAPTMNVEDLEKRINELKTVLFWLEQNQRALSATIQAMEVQKMTLSALKTMNVPVENWASTMVQSWQQFAQTTAAQMQEAGAASTAVAPGVGAWAAPQAAASPAPATAATAAQPSEPTEKKAEQAEQAEQASTAASTVTDPMQWWGALTQQFQHIAQQAVQDVTDQAMAHAASTQQAAASAAEAVRSTAEGMAEAGKAAAQAAGMVGQGSAKAAKPSAAKTGAGSGGKAPSAAAKKAVATKPVAGRVAPSKAAPRKAVPRKATPPKPNASRPR